MGNEDYIKALTDRAMALAASADIEGAQQLLREADAQWQDASAQQMLTATKNRLNATYQDVGFSEDWHEQFFGYTVPEALTALPTNVYPRCWFPQPGCVVSPFRRRLPTKVGHTERTFCGQLRRWLPSGVELMNDVCLSVADYRAPYELDIALLADGRRLRIDIEIDEPYTATTRQPQHYLTGGDDYRDQTLCRHGWVVVRLAEQQVCEAPAACAQYVTRLLRTLLPDGPTTEAPAEMDALTTVKRWTQNEALKMAAYGERERYLDCRFVPGEESSRTLPDTRLNEAERRCQTLVERAPRSHEMQQKMANFTDAGRYEQDKDIDFEPDEHIYIHEGRTQLLPVSTLIAHFFDHFDALQQAVQQWERYHTPMEESLDRWNRVGRLASEVGTFVHAQTENYFQTGHFDTNYTFVYGGKTELISVARERQHFLHFISEHAITPYRQEWPVYDTELNLAGTIDLICQETDGTFTIYDWKRSRKVVDAAGRPLTEAFGGRTGRHGVSLPDTAYYHYCIQQNLYRYMLQRHYGIRVGRMQLVVLCPDYADYHCVEVPVMDDVTAQIVACCRRDNLGRRLL